jgi:hypothetical protein
LWPDDACPEPLVASPIATATTTTAAAADPSASGLRPPPRMSPDRSAHALLTERTDYSPPGPACPPHLRRVSAQA